MQLLQRLLSRRLGHLGLAPKSDCQEKEENISPRLELIFQQQDVSVLFVQRITFFFIFFKYSFCEIFSDPQAV